MEKQNNSMLWTKTECERVTFTFSSSIEQIKWIVCKPWGGVEANTDLPGPALVWQQGEQCLGAAEDPMFCPAVPRASWDLQESNTWLNRYLASNGWLSRCRDTESPGQGAAMAPGSGRKQQQFLLYCSIALTPKPSYSLLDPGRCFVTPLQCFPAVRCAACAELCFSAREHWPVGIAGRGSCRTWLHCCNSHHN